MTRQASTTRGVLCPILSMIERSFRLRPLSSRDALVNSLGHAVRVGGR